MPAVIGPSKTISLPPPSAFRGKGGADIALDMVDVLMTTKTFWDRQLSKRDSQ